MKITQIKIEKLFGLERNDFDIECFPSEIITILYAFNGTGKTTLLKLIDAVSKNDAIALGSFLFKRVELIFDNGKNIAVEKNIPNDKEYNYYIDGKLSVEPEEIEKLKKGFKVTTIFANKDYNRNTSFPKKTNLYENKEELADDTFIATVNPIITLRRYILNMLNEPEQRTKIEQLKNIINENFPMTFKHLEIENNHLLAVPDPEYKEIDSSLELDVLSSGEQKLILMFYDLLFKANSNSIVLLDEPESSLHLDWQRNLLSSVMKICEDKELQVIVATHSPAIVEEYYCLQVPMISARYKK